MFWKICSGLITVIAAIAVCAHIIEEAERRYRESVPGMEALHNMLKNGT